MYQVDARIKRHPELQPYVPSDRYRTLTVSNNSRAPPVNGGGSGGCNSSGSSINGKINVNKSGNRLKPQATNASTNSKTNDAKPSSTSNKQPKKCVSMTRLDQLAQPKKNLSNTNNAPASGSNVKLESVKVKQELNEEEVRQLKEEEELREEEERQIEIEKEHREEQERQLKLEKELKEEEERRLRAEEELRAAARREAELRKEEERRLKHEEELKEVARREEEERQSRQKLVEDILSKFNASSSLRESE